MRISGLLWKLPLILILILLTAEGILRLNALFLPPPVEHQQRLLKEMVRRIRLAHVETKKKDPFHFPYKIFSNNNFRNEERLNRVYNDTRYPAGVWKTDDFLDLAPPMDYRISINRKGFRGVDRPEVKTVRTRRILVLGSYQAFGIGVHDEETYSHQLELILNQNSEKLNYEVWNAGRLSATAIIGLSSLKRKEFWEHGPDLVILDYGFVDHIALDNTSLGIRMLQSLSISSLLWKYLDLSEKIFGLRENFADIMEEMQKILKEHQIPVVIVKQVNAISLDDFPERFARGTYHFVNARVVYQNNPPNESDWNSVLWLKDVPKEYWRTIPAAPAAPYMKNILHLNPKGHQVLARALADKIAEIGLPSGSVSHSWTVEVPEMKYLFRDLNHKTDTPEQIRKAKLSSHDALEELYAEARKYQVKTERNHFNELHLGKMLVLQSGLEVPEPDQKKVPAKLMRTRPRSRCIVFRYSGPVDSSAELSREMDRFLKSHSLKRETLRPFLYQVSAIPVEQNEMTYYFCSPLTAPGKSDPGSR